MSQSLGKKKLLIIGPFPPPYGGVSIHIKRLKNLLHNKFEILEIDESSHIKPTTFNLRSLSFLSYFQLMAKSSFIHIHSGHYVLRFIHFCTSKVLRKKLIITVHAYEEKGKGFIEKIIDKFIFKHSNCVIFVSEEISQKFNLKNSLVKHAFLPPNLKEEEQLPLSINDWVKKKREDGYNICCANASRLDICNKEDLYGLDLTIEAAKVCREEEIKIAFVFVVSDTTGILKIHHFEDLIEEYNLANLFLLHKGSLSFVSLVELADIILRPTNTDGDAITVREGLFLKKKVIASDVVKRPEGTYVFKNRDLNSLITVIKVAKDDLEKNSGLLQPSSNLHSITTEDDKDFYLTNVYN